MPQPALLPGVRRRELVSWAFYDFANSSYTTIVITAIFNAYFVMVVAHNAPWATLAWTTTLSLSYLIVMLIAPVLGAMADARAAKKRLLAVSTAICVAFTVLLAGTGPGQFIAAAALVLLSNVAYSLGETFIAAFLPEIAREDSIGRVSGWGWATGYVGGLFTLAVCLAYVDYAKGLALPATHYVPVTLLITAAIYGLASLPTFLVLRERAVPAGAGLSLWEASYGRLWQTLRRARHYQDLFRFLICLTFYMAGISATITIAGIYAHAVMHFNTRETITLILVVNITAALGAFFFGHIQDRLGHRATLALTLLGWILMVLLTATATTRGQFWLAANIAGLCLGSSQSIGRAIVGLLSPESRRAEFYGLWGLAMRLAAIIGPSTYGLVSWWSDNDHRTAILTVGAYFVVGLLLLATIRMDRGQAAAKNAVI